MDNKQEIINEYLLGKVGYRVLEKKYGVCRSAINRWVMDFQGRPRSKSREPLPWFVSHEPKHSTGS